MARGIKDLREMVCVSRLTMREDEDEEDLSRPMSSLSLFEERLPDDKNPYQNLLRGNERDGYAMDPAKQARGKKNSVKPKNVMSPTSSVASFDFRNIKSPLPPVNESSRPPSGDDRSSSGEFSAGRLSSQSSSDERQGFYDDVIVNISDNSVNDFLRRANERVAELGSWYNYSNNFVSFCQFWLCEFPLVEQIQLIKMEVSIILDELGFVLAGGIQDGKVREVDVKSLLSAVLPEYPNKLCCLRGQHLFLNILNTLSSERKDGYKRLLTDIKVYTQNKQVAQTALAVRAYALLSLWSSIFKFYNRVQVDVHHYYHDSQLESNAFKDNQKLSRSTLRIFQAIQLGYVRTLHYLIRNGHDDLMVTDEQGRSVIFAAVMHNNPRILKYLLAKHFHKVSLTDPCESGNTAVHAAANWNHIECLELLLQTGLVDVNCPNTDCDDATPLHFAVMQGNIEAVALLLRAGANRYAEMSGVSALQLASDLGHEEISAMLRGESDLDSSHSATQMEEH